MQNYKISVSKNGKKYTIIFKAETEWDARERVHNEWYSILSVEKISDNTNVWKHFIFKAYTSKWELKHWKIVWDDIFKIYVKLRKHLEYKVELLFSEEDNNLSDSEKIKITKYLAEEYDLINNTNLKKTRLEKLREDHNKDKNSKVNNDNFYLKKQLDETYKFLDYVIVKLTTLLSDTWTIKLNSDKKEKFKTAYNTILKYKKSTNITKLKEIWELALIKIWELELDEFKEKHNESTKKLLHETNLLLKKIWSKESFVEENKNIKDIIIFFKTIFKTKKKIVKKIDKHSHAYIKNILFLKKYKEKLNENNKDIFKNLLKIIFNKDKRIELFITRKVLKQNITLFKAKEKWITYSYTYIKKWFSKILEYIFMLIVNIKNYIFWIVFIYTVFFIFFINYNYYNYFIELNYNGIFYFIIVLFIYLILQLTKNLLLIILNFVILFFIIIFWVVNF